jgi:hypothetical protein
VEDGASHFAKVLIDLQAGPLGVARYQLQFGVTAATPSTGLVAGRSARLSQIWPLSMIATFFRLLIGRRGSGRRASSMNYKLPRPNATPTSGSVPLGLPTGF